ncbi:MAG: MFS transporter [Deltaproteobacteria bacterium]|nr:MFS transporter [Deltaproteobacteria bacterium]
MIIVVACLILNSFFAEPNLYFIFACAAIISALNGLHRPAVEALMPALVKREELAAVSSLAPLRNIVTAVSGPSIAGLILATYGPIWTYLVDASTFLFSISLIAWLAIPHVQGSIREHHENFYSEIKESWLYLKNRKDLVGTYLIDFFAMVCVSPQVLMPHIAKSLSQEHYLGFLYASPSLGALIAAIFSGWTGRVNRHGLAIAFSASAWAATVAAIGLVSRIEYMLIFLFLSGAFDMISGIFRMNIWNKTIPTTIRGRMASFEMLSYMSGPLLGQLFIGISAEKLGYQNALIMGGSIAIALILASSLKLAEFIQYKDKK